MGSHRRQGALFLLVSLLASLAAVLFVPPAGAAVPSCASVSVATVNAALRIHAAHVNSTHPASPAGSLICSYYGNSGHAANQATIIFVRATAKGFAGVERANGAKYKLEPVSTFEYGYLATPNQFVFRYDSPYQVELFGTQSFGRLRKLAGMLPPLS